MRRGAPPGRLHDSVARSRNSLEPFGSKKLALRHLGVGARQLDPVAGLEALQPFAERLVASRSVPEAAGLSHHLSSVHADLLLLSLPYQFKRAA